MNFVVDGIPLLEEFIDWSHQELIAPIDPASPNRREAENWQVLRTTEANGNTWDTLVPLPPDVQIATPIATRRWRATAPTSLPNGWVLDNIADPTSREDISVADPEFSWSTLIYSNENTFSLLSQATPNSTERLSVFGDGQPLAARLIDNDGLALPVTNPADSHRISISTNAGAGTMGINHFRPQEADNLDSIVDESGP